MFKYTIFVALACLVAVVACQQEEQQQVAPKEAQAPSAADNLKNGLIDLAIIGAKGAHRIGQESRPTIEQLSKTVNEEAKTLGKRIKANKHLSGVWDQLKGHVERATQELEPFTKTVNERYEKLSGRTKPLIDRAAAKARPYLDQAEKKRQELMAQFEARQAQLKQRGEESAAAAAAPVGVEPQE